MKNPKKQIELLELVKKSMIYNERLLIEVAKMNNDNQMLLSVLREIYKNLREANRNTLTFIEFLERNKNNNKQ